MHPAIRADLRAFHEGGAVVFIVQHSDVQVIDHLLGVHLRGLQSFMDGGRVVDGPGEKTRRGEVGRGGLGLDRFPSF